jgi:SAM-dependent methyltransferase
VIKEDLGAMAIATVSRQPAGVSPASTNALCGVLADLYRRQRAILPDNWYLEEHSGQQVIRGQVELFQRYLSHLPRQGAVLDWGCYHAPDACLLRTVTGDLHDLYGCDWQAPGEFEVFHRHANLHYRPVTDLFHIPFADGKFDAVIGSGTLEHTAMDYESLKEVHRVLKPGGVFVITYLPNRLSYQEFLLRRARRHRDDRPLFHRRLYNPGQIRQLLLHTGFDPLVATYTSRFWERRVGWVVPNARWAAWLAAPLKFLLPIHMFTSSTLFAVARKVIVM